jgi:hypothetical protein
MGGDSGGSDHDQHGSEESSKMLHDMCLPM